MLQLGQVVHRPVKSTAVNSTARAVVVRRTHIVSAYNTGIQTVVTCVVAKKKYALS